MISVEADCKWVSRVRAQAAEIPLTVRSFVVPRKSRRKHSLNAFSIALRVFGVPLKRSNIPCAPAVLEERNTAIAVALTAHINAVLLIITKRFPS